MNRYDEIQMIARDIATNVHADPAKRDAMADDLIKLCTAIVSAVGKGIAVQGESNLSEANDTVFELDTESITYSDAELKRHQSEFEAEQTEAVIKAHGMYLTGEAIQDVADNVAGHSLNPQVDLDRYDPPVWQDTDRRPAYFQGMEERGVLYIPPGMQVSAPKPGQRITDLWGGACVKCGQTGRHANSCPTTKTIKDGS